MRWHARIGHDRIYIDVTIYDDAMLFNFAPMATEYGPKSPRHASRCGGLFFRLLFDHLQAGVAVILAIVIIVIYGWTQRIQGQTEIYTAVWNAMRYIETRDMTAR